MVEIEPTIEAVVDVIGPTLPVEEIVELSLWGFYTGSIGIACAITFWITLLLVVRFAIYESLKFNYYHYIRHGEFVLVWALEDEKDKKKRIEELTKELGMPNPEFVSWFSSFIVSTVVIGLGQLLGLAWPVTIIFILPLLLVRAIAYRKRKKTFFVQKLNGDHLDEKTE